jgi:hypothetical protein
LASLKCDYLAAIDTFRVQEYPIYSTPFFAIGVVEKPSNSLLLLRLRA